MNKEFLIYENNPSHPNFRGKQYEGFYITPKSKVFVRKCFIGLEKRVANQNSYETAIERVETGSAAKKYLKELRTKLIDKTQDEIVELITTGVKSYAPAGIAMVLQLVGITR